jgi:hypothetical protein
MTLAEQLAAQSTKLRPMTNTIKPIDDNQSMTSGVSTKVDKNMVLANLANQIAMA